MSARTWTLLEVRALIDALATPIAVAQGPRTVAVNDAFLRAVRRKREELEGHPWDAYIPPEERARLMERAALLQGKPKGAEGSWPLVTLGGDGQLVHFLAQVSYLPAAEGPLYALTVCQQQEESARIQAMAGMLTSVAAELAASRSAEDARKAALRQFEANGFRAAFLRPDDVFLEGEAQRALGERRVLFSGVETNLPTRALVRVDGPGGPELLSLEGPALAAAHGPTLALFSRVVGSALATGELISHLEAAERESQRQLADTRLLLELSRTTSGTLQLRAILDNAADFLVRLLDVSNCFILLYDEAERALRGAASSAAHRDAFRGVVLPLDQEGAAATSARERRKVIVEDTRSPATPVRKQLVDRFGERALMALPMISRDVLLGVVLVDDTRGPRQFSRELVERAEASVAQLALAVANARLYESLRESYAVLEATRAEMVSRERLAALGELAAVVAHEVRNPLGVIFNAVSSLRRLVSGHDGEMLLNIVGEESDRLNRIVGDLLDFARPRTLTRELEELPTFVAEAIEAARADGALSQRIRFRVELPQGLPRLAMDRHLLRQALVNVLLNAMQAMPYGGEVVVHAALEGEGRAPRTVRIDVADQGPGIPPELVDRIFEPFFTTKARGTGLGLAVVKRILEEHQGEILVRTDPGRGATFSLRLPLEHPRG